MANTSLRASIRVVVLTSHLAGSVFFCTSLANAEVITFDGLAGTNVPGNVAYGSGVTTFGGSWDAPPAFIDGYMFKALDSIDFPGYLIGPEYAAPTGGDAGDFAWNGSDYFAGYGQCLPFDGTCGPGGVSFAKFGFGPFSLNSLDVAKERGMWPFDSVVITGDFADASGGSISTTVTLNPCNSCIQTGNDFTHVSLVGFNNLSGVSVRSLPVPGSLNYGAVAIDNIDVTSAVPEPKTYAMLLAGLGLLGFTARRRRPREAAAA